MDIQSIVAELREELRRIENAINALVGLASVPTRRGRPPKSTGSRHMSAAARKRISEAIKLRWAQRKGKAAPKKATPKRKPMSPAAKKRLSALMKARGAARKKAA